MAEKRRALGRGLGALIPSSPPSGGERPVDVFFRDQRPAGPHGSPASGDGTSSALGAAGTGSIRVNGPTGTPAERWGASAAEAAQKTPERDGSGREEARTATSEQSPSGLAPVPGAEFAEIAITAISPNPKQPRTVFDEDQMAELAHSIKEIGMLQPIVVRRMSEPPVERDAETGVATEADSGQARFELIMGERRWRAAQLAGLAVVPAIIKDTHDDDLLRDALLENLHRSELNALEEAAAYRQLLDDFGCSHDELASRIGRSRPQISNTLRLLKLPPLVQRRVAAGVLSAGHARALLGMADGAGMERMAQRIVAEGLSVRSVEEIVSLGDDDTPPEPGDQGPGLTIPGSTTSPAISLTTWRLA